MDKVLNFPRPEEVPSADAEAGMLDRANRTFICTSLFLDIVEYAKKPVSQQLRVKEQFNARLSEALQDIAVNDRIILDTGDGAALSVAVAALWQAYMSIGKEFAAQEHTLAVPGSRPARQEI